MFLEQKLLKVWVVVSHWVTSTKN